MAGTGRVLGKVREGEGHSFEGGEALSLCALGVTVMVELMHF